MKSTRITLARWRLGRPPVGRIEIHRAGRFAFEEGAACAERLAAVFGDLAGLSCIDLGCGAGETVTAGAILHLTWKRLISVDAFAPYLNQLQQKTIRAQHHEIHAIRIEEIFARFHPGEIDIAVLIDVLEHFTRRDAIALLVRLERFLRRGIVIFAPVGRVEQEARDGNMLQRHRSFWQPEDWARLGYDVEVYEAFHGHLDPPATAAWAIKTWSYAATHGNSDD